MPPRPPQLQGKQSLVDLVTLQEAKDSLEQGQRLTLVLLIKEAETMSGHIHGCE